MNWKPHTEKPTGNETFAALFAFRADDGGLALLDGLRKWLPESGRWIIEATDDGIMETAFWWLAESEVLAPLAAVTKPVPGNLKPIYYWQDGYWVFDMKEADLMSEINAFGSIHQIIHVPHDATNKQITERVRELLAG